MNPCNKKRQILSICFVFSVLMGSVQAATRSLESIGPEGIPNINDIVISVSEPDIVYALANRRLLKSTDRGIHWQSVINANDYGDSPNNLLVDSTNAQNLFTIYPQSLFSNNEELKLLRSVNGGENWKYLLPGFRFLADSFLQINSAYNPFLSLVVYTEEANEKAMAMSRDGGDEWDISSNTISKVGFGEVSIEGVDHENTDTLYGSALALGTTRFMVDQHLYKSIDSGKNWIDIQPGEFSEKGSYTGGFYIHPMKSDLLYATFISLAETEKSHMMSIDGGQNWKKLGGVDDHIRLGNSLFFAPNDADIVYANIFYSGEPRDNQTKEILLAKSIDSGITWQIKQTGFFTKSPLSTDRKIVVDPENSQTVLWATAQGIIRSDDSGETWKTSHQGMKLIGGTLTLNEGAPDLMYLVHEENNSVEYYKSNDAGKHWEIFSPINLESMTTEYCEAFILNPIDEADILCKTDRQLYRSQDSGDNWRLIIEQDSLSYNDLQYIIYANDGKTIYAKSREEFIVSTNNGETWKNIEIEEDESYYAQAVIADPINSNIVYTIANVNRSTSVYKSIDRGSHWKKQIGAITSDYQMIMDYSHPERLLFVDGMKAFLSENGGDSWRKVSESFRKQPSGTEVSLVFNPRNSNGLFLSTREGVFESKDLGVTWTLVIALEDVEAFNGFAPIIKVISGDVFLQFPRGIFKTTLSSHPLKSKNCLFEWTEQQYPLLFGFTSTQTQVLEDYTYRYYKETNTYLGFYQDKSIHLLQASKTDHIEEVGYLENYLSVAGCGG